TSSMSDGDMWKFAKSTQEQAAAFSPVFKPHKAGNVVNMGNINANDVLLIGNKVSIDGGHINGKHNDNVSGDALKNPSGNTADKVHLVGNEVNILVDGIKSDSIIASAYVKGLLQQSTSSYYNYDNNIGKLVFETKEYNNIDKSNLDGKNLVTNDKFEKHATIGSDVDWWHFAKGWNEDKNNMKDFFDTYKLVNDIDFGANCKNGVCSGQNYANYWIDLNGDGIKQDNEFTNMIVGYNDAIINDNFEIIETYWFTKFFDGQGFTLKNINIDTTAVKNKDKLKCIGIFGCTNDGAVFKNINVDYKNGGINAKDVNDNIYIGGFVGAAIGNFENIIVDNINEIKFNSKFGGSVGGFAGGMYRGNFKNIILNKVGKIDIKAGGISAIGGFAGNTNDVSLENIVLNEIGKINIKTDGSVAVGGFAGSAYGDFKNIVLNEIGKIDIKAAYTVSAGGFAGSAYGDFKNITINSPIDIRADYKTPGHSESTNIGGFAGGISGGKFENISLENITIELISSGRAYVGGFAGLDLDFYDGGFFKNIALKNITTIGYYRNFGGFIGYMDFFHKKDNTFENIYIFSIQKTDGNWYGSGKFLGGYPYSEDDKHLKFNNVHIYHHKNELNDINCDQIFWGNTSDKIQIHIYNDDNKGKFEEYFTQQANAIPKPMLPIIPPFKPTDPIDPSNPDVILDSDDLYGGIIASIINEIRNEKYTIDIKNLVSLINAFKGLNKDSSENEIKAVIKTHLGIDDDKALSMAQSISFLLNYQEHNFDGRLSDEALAVYNNTIKPSVNNTLGLISYLDKNKDYLLEQYNKHKELEQVFKDKEQAYKKAEAEFNRLLDLVNKGKLSYNDPKFTQAFDNWLNAYNDYNDLSNDISELNNNVEKIANYITDENKGLAYTKFSFTKFDDIAKIDLVKPELPDIDNSQGGDLPAFEQTASLNLIGDNALDDDDDEKKEIDETSLAQKNKTCIVSDNYKTMNPCVAGM
ncbi:hypothetical protein IO405_001624, partial [Campylobacter lari]|nr:hypothetical protein [Campylobacter lari]